MFRPLPRVGVLWKQLVANRGLDSGAPPHGRCPPLKRIALPAAVMGCVAGVTLLSGCEPGGSNETKIPDGYHSICVKQKDATKVADSGCSGLDAKKGGVSASGGMWVWVPKGTQPKEGERLNGSLLYFGNDKPNGAK